MQVFYDIMSTFKIKAVFMLCVGLMTSLYHSQTHLASDHTK